MSDLIKNIGDSEFELEVLKSNGLVLVDFFAPWCGPCVQLSPNLEKLANDMNSIVKIVKINVDENNKYASEYGVRSIPNLILFKNGSKVDEMVGFKNVEQLKEFVEKHNK
jgi:thioredoxin 1